jgi:hypothetical protein
LNADQLTEEILNHFRLIIFLALALCASFSALAETVLLTDESGSPLGRLPYMQRGEEQLIPSALLATKANWQREREANDEIITAPGSISVVRRGNPFAKVNDGHVQLRLPPEEWDGSLWIPISGLESLFPGSVMLDSASSSLKVKLGAIQEGLATGNRDYRSGARRQGSGSGRTL